MTAYQTWEHFHEAGNMAFYRGMHENALSDYFRALAIARQTKDPSALAETLRAIAKTYLGVGKVTEAKKCAAEAWELDHAYWGAQSQNVNEDLALLGEVLRLEGDLARARNVFEKVLSFRIALFGYGHELSLEMFMKLIWVDLEEGRYEGLVAMTKCAVDSFSHVHPQGKFGQAFNLTNLLTPYIEQGRYQEAEVIADRAMLVLRTVFGDKNSELSVVMNEYYEIMKQVSERVNIARWQSKSDVASEVYSLELEADSFAVAGELGAGMATLRRLLANLYKRAIPDKAMVSRVLAKYAGGLDRMGRSEDAEILRRRSNRLWHNPGSYDLLFLILDGSPAWNLRAS
jgi:tetratricopeptide (TPR) repeat protein